MPLLQEPMTVLVALAATCGLIAAVGRLALFAPLFRYVPPVLLVVFLPAALSAAGLLPRSSVAYDVLRDYALPFGLLLMVAMTDVRAVFRIGPRALVIMVAGSLGVIVGAILVFALVGSALPTDSWKMFAAITGSWIGGGANFAAVQSSVQMSPDLVGPAIVVDATINYIWLGLLLLGVSYQHWVTRFYQPDPRFEPPAEDSRSSAATRDTVSYESVLIVLGVGLPAAAIAMALGRWSFALLGDGNGALSVVLGDYALGIVFVTLFGVLLSLTPVRRLEHMGGPPLAYAAQFLFFASLGAQANFAAVLDMPVLVLAGLVWILIHALVLLCAARLLRAPMALIAVASIASIGGSSTAALVGAQYGKSWASLGVLLGLVGSLTGTFAGLACGYFLAGMAP
jgi:uncharacterized membrane protein